MTFIPHLTSPEGEEYKKLPLLQERAGVRIPFWRKELNYKADIAEEIARID